MGIGGSIHTSSGWEGQFETAQRWHRRLDIVRSHRRRDANTADDWDFVHAFFQNCFYLKDWLERSGVVPASELHTFINAHLEMQLCRDICNGTKHFEITKPSVDAEFSLLREYVPANDPSPRPHINERWLIIAGNERVGSHRFDIFELADKCMELWHAFLNQKGLL